jgi:hypothetical protein
MENVPSYNIPTQNGSSPEAVKSVDVWTQIEAIDLDMFKAHLDNIVSPETISRLRLNEKYKNITDVRLANAEGDLVDIDRQISEAEELSRTIELRVTEGSGRCAVLDMKITRSANTDELEGEKLELLSELAELQQQYFEAGDKLDGLYASKAMLMQMGVAQQEYASRERLTWIDSGKYKEVLRHLAHVATLIEELAPTVPIPIAPPDLASQNPADLPPMTIDGSIDATRQLLSIDIQEQIQQVAQKKTEPESELDDKEPLTYRSLVENLTLTKNKITLPAKYRNILKNIASEDVKA